MSKSRKSSPAAEAEIQRALSLLRQVMRRRKKTQLEVQKVLGWGRSSISQMMTGQKSVRLGQLLDILGALEIPPAEFFAELYDLEKPAEVARQDEVVRVEGEVKDLAAELQDLKNRLGRLETDEKKSNDEVRAWKLPPADLQSRFKPLRKAHS